MTVGILTRAGRRIKSAKVFSVSTEDKLLVEIETEINVACPEYAGWTRLVRQFVATKLSSKSKFVLGVISANPGEGRTTVALGLASAVSEIYERVVFVESNLAAAAGLEEETGNKVTLGLLGYLGGEIALDTALQSTKKPGLSVLTAGSAASQGSNLAMLSSMRKLISELRGKFDISIIELPALLSSEEGGALLSELDAAVIVVEAGRTSLADAQKTIAACGSLPIEGIILNRSSQRTPKWLASLLTAEDQRADS